MPNPVGYTHDQAVTMIIKHRLANPAIVAKHKLATDFQAVSSELIRFQQARGALPPDVLPKPTPPVSTPSMSGAVSASVAAVKKVAAGTALLLEWEADGLPHVDPQVAEDRASVCAVCPKNEKGKSLIEIFTAPAAALIQKRMERFASMNLRTSKDAELAVCQACLCQMRSKVWVPSELILKRLKPEQKSELHESCWILKLQSPTSSSPKAPLAEITSPVS